jgi:PAS domain-containing protein
MGFTLTKPGSDDLEQFTKLHFVGRTVGFTCIGPIVNHSTRTLQGLGKWREKLDIFPMQAFPEPGSGEIVTVEMTSSGELKRYRDGALMSTVMTNTVLGEGEWYGAFEISMNVARVTLCETDPYLESAQAMDTTERQLIEIVEAERKLADQREIAYVSDLFVILLSNAQHLSISIASARADNPLIAVSDGFQSLTGYKRNDVLGRNCRFLNTGSGMSDTDRSDIRHAIKTGEHFCAVLPNVRADGTHFNNLLDLRTLEIGIDAFGAPVRFIVGIQGEVAQPQRPNEWKRALPTLSETLRCNLSIILQAFQTEFRICDGVNQVLAHPVPFWVDTAIN